MKKPLVTAPNQILRNISKEVVVDKKINEFIVDLSDSLLTQTNPRGVGLSAPQIGKNYRIFATLLNEDEDKEPKDSDLKIFINPKVISHSVEKTLGDDPQDPIMEGCLSIPNLYGPVPRFTWIEIEYETLEHGRSLVRNEKFEGFAARVIQHEQDHLDGILFVDHTSNADLPFYEYRGKKLQPINRQLVDIYLQ